MTLSTDNRADMEIVSGEQASERRQLPSIPPVEFSLASDAAQQQSPSAHRAAHRQRVTNVAPLCGVSKATRQLSSRKSSKDWVPISRFAFCIHEERQICHSDDGDQGAGFATGVSNGNRPSTHEGGSRQRPGRPSIGSVKRHSRSHRLNPSIRHSNPSMP